MPVLIGSRRALLGRAAVAVFDPLTDAAVAATWKHYQDADASFAATADGTAVSSWPDLSGQTKHATQATGAKQPTVQTVAGLANRKVVRYDGGDGLATASVTLGTKATVYLVVNQTTNAATAVLWELGATGSGANNAGIYRESTNNFDGQILDAVGGVGHGEIPLTGDALQSTHRILAIRLDQTLRKGKLCFWRDGMWRYASFSAANTNVGGTGLAGAVNLGARNAGASVFQTGDCAFAAAAAGRHTTGQLRKMLAYLSARFGIAVTLPSGLVAHDGDSNTDAISPTATTSPYSHQVMNRFTNSYDTVNFGVGGQGFGSLVLSGTMAFDAATQVDPLVDATYGGKNVLVVMNGINDLFTPTSGATAFNNATKETTLQRAKDYLSARKAAGWQTVLFTLLPNNNPSWDATAQADYMATERPYMNNWIKNNAVSDGYCDAIVDLTVNAFLEDYTNTTYWETDQAHLKTAGHTLVTNYLETALDAIGVT